jgi:hypothetical protein
MIVQARNGGSMTPAMGLQLQREVRNGNLRCLSNQNSEWFASFG